MAEKSKAVKLTTPKFRLSFPSLDIPRGFEGQEPKYSITMLFPKNEDMGWLKNAMQAFMTDRFGPDKTKWPKGIRNPIRDGDEQESPLTGYEGQYFVKASTKDKPGVVDAKCQDIIDVKSEVYAGCYCRATIAIFYYDKGVNKGIGIALNNIQKLADGVPFGGKRPASKDFDAVESEAAPAASGTSDELFG